MDSESVRRATSGWIDQIRLISMTGHAIQKKNQPDDVKVGQGPNLMKRGKAKPCPTPTQRK